MAVSLWCGVIGSVILYLYSLDVWRGEALCHGLQLCGCYLLQMFSGRKLRVDLAESSGGDRERGDNFGRSGQFAVVVTLFFLSKLKLLLASKKGTEFPARDKEVLKKILNKIPQIHFFVF